MSGRARAIIAIALVLGFAARGVLDVWPSAQGVMPLVLVLLWGALVNAATRQPKPPPDSDPDSRWREAADD